MHIIVPIKQVPETSNVKMDTETGTMIRSGVESVVNPLDLYAIETALRIRETNGGTVTVITMGPLSAERVLREAVAMGCDEAVHLSDRKFGGADTWATSYTLAQGILKIGSYDLIITGERATDGDTGQVGPGIAAWLNIPLATYVSKIDSITEKRMEVERLIEEGYQSVRITLPAVMTVVKEAASPRLPTLKGKKRAKQLVIPLYGYEDIAADPKKIGLKGSPTRVVKIEIPKVTRTCRSVAAHDDEGVKAAVDELMAYLSTRGVL
ncbi:MAG: electron transfer flavoprotein subunit beta/FixA family protein [Bacteroidetes bacterium]|nr:electron transfer flavoprotein subunit beta/FixA family protein [Bacteroidota bacterium]